MQHFLVVFGLAAIVSVVLAMTTAAFIGRLGFPVPAEARRIGCIDGLRGFLALAVLVHHCFIWIQSTWIDGAWRAPPINVLNQLGAGAVTLFFMVTGLVFYPRILAGARRTTWSTHCVGRLFRIVPLTAVSVLLVTALVACRTHALPDGRYPGAVAQWISAWSEVPLLDYPDTGRINAYVLWSLWYEWLFYILLLPACAGAMDLLRNGHLPSWILPASLLAIGVIGRSFLSPAGPVGSVILYLPQFAIGMLAFEIQARPTVRTLLSTRWMSVAACAALLAGMVASNAPDGISIPLFGLFFVSVACGNSLGGLLHRRSALVLGECSFGIYLLHGILLDVLFIDTGALGTMTTSHLALMLPVAAMLATLITPVTHLLVERPAIRRGKALAAWITATRIRAASRPVDLAS